MNDALRAALADLHRWEVTRGWTEFNDILAHPAVAAALAGSGPAAELAGDAVEAMTDAIVSQDLWHGRHATSPAGSATARAILSCLRNHHRLALAATPTASPTARVVRERVIDPVEMDPTASPTVPECMHPADALTDHSDNPSRFRCRACGSVLVDYGDGLGYRGDEAVTTPDALRAALAEALLALRWWEHAYPDDGDKMWATGDLSDAILAHPAVAAALAGSGPAGLREEHEWREAIVAHLGPQRMSLYMNKDIDMMARGAFIAERLAATPTASPTATGEAPTD